MNPPTGWVDEHTPSPTSVLGVNVRYYHVTIEPSGIDEYIDLGLMMENLIEALYPGYTGTGGTAGFEAAVRGAYDELLKALHAVYPLHLVTCLATGDTDEVQREAEHRELLVARMRRRTEELAKRVAPAKRGLSAFREFFS